ncbi:MAG: hypothetical protein HPY61_07220 [Methanotrichaceae archaeon]|nr:hypothetical protein [Methanotrichaceae archaeon]
MMLFSNASGRDDMSDLTLLVSSFDDPLMDAQDLAFYLATHSYDATPKEGRVELDLKGERYILIPNGRDPGLCKIIAAE